MVSKTPHKPRSGISNQGPASAVLILSWNPLSLGFLISWPLWGPGSKHNRLLYPQVKTFAGVSYFTMPRILAQIHPQSLPFSTAQNIIGTVEVGDIGSPDKPDCSSKSCQVEDWIWPMP